jgi:hypothetical protein
MKKENKYLIVFSFFIFLVFSAGYYLYLNDTLTVSDWKAFLTGGSFTTLNFFLGIISLKLALNAHNKFFIAIVLGGMMVRMIMMLGVVYAGIRFLEIRIDVFIFVIFVFYTIYLVFEVLYFYLLRERIK